MEFSSTLNAFLIGGFDVIPSNKRGVDGIDGVCKIMGQPTDGQNFLRSLTPAVLLSRFIPRLSLP
jgi:hypothetical protein